MPRPFETHFDRALMLVLLSAGALGSLGCANPGPPRPPSLDLPAPVRDLAVQRIGDRLEARWTTPRLTTDKTVISGPIRAVLCLERAASVVNGVGRAPAGTPACSPAGQQTVSPGPATMRAALPPDLSSGAPRLLTYRMELDNARGRSAGPSNPAWTAAGAAPVALGSIVVQALPEGALVTWQRASQSQTGERVELTRTSKGTSEGTGNMPRGAIRTAAQKRPAAAPAEEEIRLAAGADPEAQQDLQTAKRMQQTDAGGLLDRSVESGVAYTYVAERVRDVTLEGHRVRMLGEASAPVTLTYRDVFPPRPPVGLEGAPSGGFAQDASPAPALSLDLSWEPSREGDLAGYNVYRSDDGGPFARRNSALVPVPQYRDTAVQPGRLYRYRVTAVDTHANESAPGAVFEEQLHPQ